MSKRIWRLELSRHRALIAAATPALFLGLQGVAYAKRDPEYPPPPYFERLGLSFTQTLPLAVLVVLVCGVGAIWLSGLPKPATRRLLEISGRLFVFGCFFAAMDDWNDELWNPVFRVSCFLSPIPVVALYLNSKEDSTRGCFVMLAPVIAAPTLIALLFLGGSLQDWAMAHGLPAGW
jgi:hypothetical protein